ncbi:MAG: ATP-dependent sacrificial sulfur transferase LarE [Spirochaetaceae bacterium]|jgi:uncharacterized protein|nr:ATP-dependent sacrificial sulfur transferase LarE [Spirochaetaceae bacterium]
MDILTQKYESLLNLIKKQKSAAVAFSGGVDSSFLCYAAARALGEASIAITLVSPMLPKTELQWARRIAALTGIRHIILEDGGIEDAVAENPKNRCYYCKKIEFGAIIQAAKENGAFTVMDGSNADDENDYRPGLKAVEELSVLSPLRECGFTKDEIRLLSKKASLPTWDKPQAACLASRIPYGERITAQKLKRVEEAEEVMRNCGFNQFRVRSHGDIARVEVDAKERRLFFNEDFLDALSAGIKKTGFTYVCFELEGYKTGSLNAPVLEGGYENSAF